MTPDAPSRIRGEFQPMPSADRLGLANTCLDCRGYLHHWTLIRSVSSQWRGTASRGFYVGLTGQCIGVRRPSGGRSPRFPAIARFGGSAGLPQADRAVRLDCRISPRKVGGTASTGRLRLLAGAAAPTPRFMLQDPNAPTSVWTSEVLPEGVAEPSRAPEHWLARLGRTGRSHQRTATGVTSTPCHSKAIDCQLAPSRSRH